MTSDERIPTAAAGREVTRHDRAPVLIAGGGIAGLATAAALGHEGVDALVVEQSPALREAGAGVQIWVSALAALRRVGLERAVSEAGSPVEVLETRSSRGLLLQRTPIGSLAADHGLPAPVVIARQRLLEVLAAGVDPARILLGQRCVRYEQDHRGVTLHLAGGREVRGTVLVGADGIGSMVRSALFPATAPTYAGCQSLRALVDFTHPAVPEGVFTFWQGRGVRFGIGRVAPGSVWWFAVVPARERTGDTPEGRRHELLHRFRRFPDPVRAAIAATAEDAILRHDVRDIEPLPRWGEGRVTLVGDAAHAASVAGGRGVTMAIEDGVVLAERLAAVDAGFEASALSLYEQSRRPAAHASQVASRRAGEVLSWTNPMACAYRDARLRFIDSRRAALGLLAELQQVRDRGS